MTTSIALPDVPTDTKPIRRAMAAFTEGSAIRGRTGNLFLFPDRIVHVSSRGAMAAFGWIGLMVSRSRAEGRARRGGLGVTQLALRDVDTVRSARYGLSGHIVEMDTHDGRRYRMGVKYEKWQQTLRDVLTAQGLQVSDVENGFQVHGATPAPPAAQPG